HLHLVPSVLPACEDQLGGGDEPWNYPVLVKIIVIFFNVDLAFQQYISTSTNIRTLVMIMKKRSSGNLEGF
ncbi:MAG: hypothetical protein ACKO3I_10525, partial [Synechococcales cyanobacterium]